MRAFLAAAFAVVEVSVLVHTCRGPVVESAATVGSVAASASVVVS